MQRWGVVMTLAYLLAGQGMASAAARKSGADIYKQMCVKCHGKAGEGVKGKYDDVLYGDWSVEKLTRYIDKNMPEDKPGKCVGPDADAVARYIYDAFYTKEARARNNPARVDLVRLTNRQYLNTATDLLRELQGGELKLLSSQHGLQASYSARQGRRSEGNTGSGRVEKVERQIDFDFGTNAPDFAATSTNGFSMRWTGSVIADETGEHEFILKTANGTRLWVNEVGDNDKMLIDAGVNSGGLMEMRGSIRLIAGRSYPIRLEMNKQVRDKITVVSLQWKAPHGAQMVIPARNLSPERSPSTFVLTTPFPADDSSVGYERGMSVSQEWDEAATHAAIEVANYVVKRLDQFSRSRPADADRVAKVQSFCRDFVESAFRRPLTDEQQRIFVTAHFKGQKLEDSVKRVVLLALKSPRFLYLGLEGDKADDYTVAQRLAFGLWDSLPDKELKKAAAAGALRTPEQVAAQAKRMLADPRARSKTQAFFQHWLQMNHVEDLSKDAKLYPGFTPEIISDLRTSLNLFLEDVVWNGDSDYRKFLLADYLFLNDRLAKFYGVKTNGTDEFLKVALNPKERSGVMTHPYLLAEFSYQRTTSPIHRGVFLTRNIVGRALRPPPVAVAFKDAEFSPHLTMREKITELTRSESCQTCHSVINPLGFALENFDAVGRFRTGENGKPVNARSEYTTDDGKVVQLKGARDVAEFAVASEHSKNVFIEQLFHSIAKQPLLAYGPNVLTQLHQSFAASGYNVQKLMVEIATISARYGSDKPAAPTKKRT
jgi:hypothetical protein